MQTAHDRELDNFAHLRWLHCTRFGRVLGERQVGSTAIRCRSRLGGRLNFYHREAA